MRDLIVSLFALLFGALVGAVWPVHVPERFSGEQRLVDPVQTFLNKTQGAQDASELEKLGERYTCDLKASQGMPFCRLKFKETADSMEQDVKCRILQDALSTGRGSYVKTGSFLMDEGRFRTNMNNLDECDFLPTDSMMYPHGGEVPLCSDKNRNLFDPTLGHGDIVSINEVPDEGRCRVTFKTASRPQVLAYSSYLDQRAREMDILAAQRDLTLAKATKQQADQIAATSLARLRPAAN
jgi:hypothetical protein